MEQWQGNFLFLLFFFHKELKSYLMKTLQVKCVSVLKSPFVEILAQPADADCFLAVGI